MGFLRTYLALLVVFAHLRALDTGLDSPFVGGAILAVKFFFLLSGFYMSLVLDKKYRARPFEFFKSRFFRLYPLYWATCLLVLVFVAISAGQSQPVANLQGELSGVASPWMRSLVVLSNITFLGSDLLKFIVFDPGDASQFQLFPRNAPAALAHLQQFLVIQPAWTLGIEVAFYLAAPFLFRKGWHGILLLLAISVTSRLLLFGIGYQGYDWSRHFLLSEAIYFALGMASYRIHQCIPGRIFTRESNWLAAFLLFGWTTMYAYGGLLVRGLEVGDRLIWETLYHWGFMAAAVVSVPFLFELSRHSRADFFAGELSYPIYITHYPAAQFVLPLFRNATQEWPMFAKLGLSVGVVFAVALLGIALVSYPVERLRGRHSMQARHAAPQSA